jgi:predicted amidohydrolase
LDPQHVCGSDGSQRAYRKTHLGAREKKDFLSGKTVSVFEEEPPFGILICYEYAFPEAAAKLRAGAPVLIAVPHASPEHGRFQGGRLVAV